MVASIGSVAAPSQGVSYYERDGYYAKDDPDHRTASAWAGKGAVALGLSGPVDPDVFTSILEGRVPDGPQLGRPGKDGEIVHQPGRDLTLSAPKSVSLAALVGGDARVAEAHGQAVERTLAWVEGRVVETRMKDPETVMVIDEGSLASTVQARDLLRIASELRIPKLVLVGDAKQLEAVDAGKPFAQLQQAGMKTAVMDEMLRQRDPDREICRESPERNAPEPEPLAQGKRIEMEMGL